MVAKTDFSDAPIKYEAQVRGPEETGINVFAIGSDQEKAFFEVSYRFGENGNDFHVVISNFGIPEKSLAGSKNALVQRLFTPKATQSAKQRISEYFSGSEDKPYFPFNMGKGRFLGVDFPKNWIVTGNSNWTLSKLLAMAAWKARIVRWKFQLWFRSRA